MKAGVTVAGYPLGATVSVGAASAATGANIATLLAAADRALYRAKAKGRNRIEGADGVMPAAPSAAEETQPAERFWHAWPGQMRLRVIASGS